MILFAYVDESNQFATAQTGSRNQGQQKMIIYFCNKILWQAFASNMEKSIIFLKFVENLRIYLNLPKNQGKVLSNTKIKSLSEEYFSIPECYRKYYPSYVKPIKKKIKPNNSILASAKRKLVAKTNPTSKCKSKKRKVSRPKIQPKIPEGIRSITTYFRAE